MPVTKTSTVKGFDGTVVFHEPLNLEQVFAVEEAQDNATDIEPSKFLTRINEIRGEKDDKGETVKIAWSSRSNALFLPAILLCVKEWHIEKIPPDVTRDTFPMTPRSSVNALIDWCWNVITDIYQGETEIPNA